MPIRMARTFRRSSRPNGGPARSWYSIRAAANDTAEILIYDEIGYWGVTADDFVRELRSLDAKNITLRLNSPGGDVFDGLAIYNALRSHPATIVTQIDGIAASMASVIAMAGDTVTAYDASFLMIHNPWGFVIGDYNDMRKMAAALEKTAGVLAHAYASKTGKSDDAMAALMDAETWFTAAEAAEIGLVDTVIEDGESAAAAAAKFDLSAFGNVPASLRGASSDQHQDPPDNGIRPPNAELMRRRLRLQELDL